MSPEDVVRAYAAAWKRLDVEGIVSYDTPDAVYENVPIGAATGHAEIREAIQAVIGSITFFDIEIHNIAVAGNVVLTERVDHIVMDGTPIPFRIMGVFEVEGDKITAKRDYFNVGGQS
jgi:limonene-1,2-epoxide hydrolase